MKLGPPRAKHRRRDELPILRPPASGPIAEAAMALPWLQRLAFVRVASIIANDEGDGINPAALEAFEKRGLLVTLKMGGATIPTLTDHGVDVALWLADDFERGRQAEQFSLLFPRRRAEAIARGPCPGCGQPLIMVGLFLCSKCLAHAPRPFRRAAAAETPHPWAGRDGGWRTVGAPPPPRPEPSRHQRIAELACIIAARLRLGEA